MKSRLFCTDQYAKVEAQIKEFLNGQDRFLSGSTAKSTRAVGDAIQDIHHCMEHNIPIIVFNYRKEGNIQRVIAGEKLGTRVGPAGS